MGKDDRRKDQKKMDLQSDSKRQRSQDDGDNTTQTRKRHTTPRREGKQYRAEGGKHKRKDQKKVDLQSDSKQRRSQERMEDGEEALNSTVMLLEVKYCVQCACCETLI